MQKLKLPELSQPILSKNSRCWSFYGWFPLKTLGKEAFSVNFLKKLKVLVLYQPISSTKLKLLEHKNSIFITQGLFTKKNSRNFLQNSWGEKKTQQFWRKNSRNLRQNSSYRSFWAQVGTAKSHKKKAWSKTFTSRSVPSKSTNHTNHDDLGSKIAILEQKTMSYNLQAFQVESVCNGRR